MPVPKRKKDDMQAVRFEPLHLTMQAKRGLEEKLKHLKHALPGYAAETARTAAYGDRSENAEYQDAKAKLRRTQRQIWTIEDQLKRTIIIEERSHPSGTVQLGSTVLIEFADGTKKKFKILGPHETDPAAGVISHESPLGKALLGHKTGDMIKIKTEIGEQKYRVREIY